MITKCTATFFVVESVYIYCNLRNVRLQKAFLQAQNAAKSFAAGVSFSAHFIGKFTALPQTV